MLLHCLVAMAVTGTRAKASRLARENKHVVYIERILETVQSDIESEPDGGANVIQIHRMCQKRRR